MAAKSVTFSNDILKLIFNGTTIPNLAQNASSPLTNLYVSLHTSSPGAIGNQATNEAAYGGYSRVAVSRNAGGWNISTNNAHPTSTITFPIAVSGTETETFFAVGTSLTGAGLLLYFGPINPNLSVTAGKVPQLLIGTVIHEF